MQTTLVFIKKLRNDAIIPKYFSREASGCDCVSPGNFIVPPGQTVRLGLGFAVCFPDDFEIQIRGRSGWNKHDDYFKGQVEFGTVDSDYRGEIKIKIRNFGQYPIYIRRGDRDFAQMVLCPKFRMDFQEVDELPETERGDGGFGSTGNRIEE